jgi:hypothetical protein
LLSREGRAAGIADFQMRAQFALGLNTAGGRLD